MFDGVMWHLYGSGGTSGAEIWQILHATAPSIHGPWTEQPPVTMVGVSGDHVAAPGVVIDQDTGRFHMFVQRDFMALGGTVEHLVSIDAEKFTWTDTPLRSLAGTDEAGIYDPHPSEINGKKYLVYSGTNSFTFTGTYYIGRPDLFLAESLSDSWKGPWIRKGKILGHADVASHHNQLTDPDYEWGLEGPQLIGLPNGKVLLTAVCFLPGQPRGYRQRVFFAVADSVTGPYRSLGPVLNSLANTWEAGETGHAAGLLHEDMLYLFYQGRSVDSPWRYGLATFPLPALSTENEARPSDAPSSYPADGNSAAVDAPVRL